MLSCSRLKQQSEKHRVKDCEQHGPGPGRPPPELFFLPQPLRDFPEAESGVVLLPASLERGEQQLELLLVRRNRFGRSRQLDEHVPARRLDDRAEEAVAGDGP